MQIVFKLDVDDVTGSAFRRFSSERKQHFVDQVNSLLQQMADHDRVLKLKKLIQEMNQEQCGPECNPEILYELFRGEDED